MIVEMCRDDITVFVVCRMLYRCEFLDLYTYRKNDDSTRMLACRSSDSRTALDDPVDLAVTLVLATLFVIILDITECRFLCQGTNRTSLECLTFSEDNLCISVRIRLIFSGEVQVDIRLLVTLETKECLERDIKSFFVQLRAAFRADLIRHIATCHTAEFLYFRRIKIMIFAVRAQIVWRKRINLRDTGHRRRERRSY